MNDRLDKPPSIKITEVKKKKISAVLGLVIDIANPWFIPPGRPEGGREVEHVFAGWAGPAPCGGGVLLPLRDWCRAGGALIRRGGRIWEGLAWASEVVGGYRYFCPDVELHKKS